MNHSDLTRGFETLDVNADLSKQHGIKLDGGLEPWVIERLVEEQEHHRSKWSNCDFAKLILILSMRATRRYGAMMQCVLCYTLQASIELWRRMASFD
jgi:hypothetical protein